MSNVSRCQWCGKDFDSQHAIEAYRPEGERYGPVCSDQCLAQAGCISREKKERQEKEATIRQSSQEARRLLQQGKYEEAVAAADKMAALDGRCVEAKVIKGLALAKKGRYELAVAVLEEALKLDAGHAEAKEALEALFADADQVIGYARAKYEEKAYDAVAVLAGKVIERSPSCFDAYLLRGKAHRQTKKYREAVQDLTEALKSPSGEEKREALRERGACHLDLKDTQAAIEDCSAALQIDGQDGAALLTRARSRLARKERALAAIDFYETARLDPALKGDAAKGIEECEKGLTPTLLAEAAEQPGAGLTGEQRQGLGKVIEIYKLKEKVAEIEKKKKRATSPLLVVLLSLGLASLVSCFGLFAAPFRYEWYGPFLFLNLTWVAFAAWEFFRFKSQQRLDRTVNAPLVVEIERQLASIKEHEASFGLDRAPKKDANHAPGIVVLGVILLALSAGWLWGIIKPQERVRAEVAAADQQWEAGQREEALAKYKQVIDSDLAKIAAENRPKLFQRLVEYELARGDLAAAKGYLDGAAKQKVILPPDVAQRVQDREGQLAAERAKKDAAERAAAAQAERDRKEAALKAEQEKKRQAEAVALKKKLEQVPDLLRRLKDENGQVRALAAGELAQIKPLPAEALEPLLVAVNDSGDPLSIAVRTSAIKALGNCDPSDKSVKALEALLNDETIAVQSAALQALKEMGKSGLPTVAKALAHPNPLIRGQAARILADSGEAGKQSVPDLLKAMKEEQEEGTRVWMAGAIVKLDPEEPAPIPVLIKALDPGRAAATRKTAAEFLGEVGPKAKAAVPALEAMVMSGNAAEATAARKALEKIKK